MVTISDADALFLARCATLVRELGYRASVDNRDRNAVNGVCRIGRKLGKKIGYE